MKIDRELQRKILQRLADICPGSVSTNEFEGDSVEANIYYLKEHGLIRTMPRIEMHTWPTCQITGKGLDFLADDGGLSAILGTITVKLHTDTLMALLEPHIEASELPAAEKSKLTEHLRALPAEAMKTVTKRLLEAALDQVPNAIQLIQKLLGS